MKRNIGLIKIWSLFIGFVALFLVNFGIKTNIGYTSMMWLILDFCVLILSIIILIKNKFPRKNQVLISLVFGFLMFVAYQGISFSSIKGFLITFLTSLAMFSIFNLYEKNSLKLLKANDIKSILITIGIGIIVGVVLGVINLFISGEILNFNIKLSYFLVALSPGIYEEIALRAFIYSLCIYVLKDEINTRFKRFTCYFMMTIPHVMIHTPEQFINQGVISGIMAMIILTILFGLPFAFLQRKRDITSAMIGHGLVDVIRFCFLGLPY